MSVKKRVEKTKNSVICQNFVHRKCSNLSVTDIDKHISIDVPFYCKICNDDIFPLSEEENQSPFFNGTPNNAIFNCGSVLDPSHLNSLFSSSNGNDDDLAVERACQNFANGFQPIADKYYSADQIPFDDFEITAQNRFADKFSSIGINMRSLANTKNFAKLQVFVDSLCFKPSVIAINETFLSRFFF